MKKYVPGILVLALLGFVQPALALEFSATSRRSTNVIDMTGDQPVWLRYKSPDIERACYAKGGRLKGGSTIQCECRNGDIINPLGTLSCYEAPLIGCAHFGARPAPNPTNGGFGGCQCQDGSFVENNQYCSDFDSETPSWCNVVGGEWKVDPLGNGFPGCYCGSFTTKIDPYETDCETALSKE